MSNAESSASAATHRPRIALVAGEASGDQLGAALIRAIRQDYPQARFLGVGGPGMVQAGLECWHSSDELAVMGLFEVLRHLPRLLKFRKSLVQRLVQEKPDLLIGIDAPDFNLGLERRVRRAGIRAIHYVSPTVWAWRQGRVKTIAASTDMVLCRFPFEPDFYAEHGVAAKYTCHQMADELALVSDQAVARAQLGLEGKGPIIALLPGSRLGEVSRLAEPLLQAAKILASQHPNMRFVAPTANRKTRECFERSLGTVEGVPVTVLDGQARQAMAAADVVICASGTAALEAMLVNRPMVVTYKLSALTYATARTFRLFKNRFFSLPNILADEALVPELLQNAAQPERIAAEVRAWIDDPERCQRVQGRFDELHRQLRKDAARAAAACVRDVLEDAESGEPGW
jgi:lipid-A-disaccharide synthase